MLKRLFLRFRVFWLIFKDPRTPWWAKTILITLAVVYGLSPIDLVPDWIPLAGLLDDVIVVPFLLWLITRFAPKLVRQQSRERAEADTHV